MFTIPVGSTLSLDVIKSAIKYNEDKREAYNRLERYYLGSHDILYREKLDSLKNNKVIVNHAKYITDINTGYLLGNPVEYQTPEEVDIDPVLEQYKFQTISDLDHEIAKDVSVFGRQYELVYTSDNAVKSKDVDVRNCIIVYDDSVEHNKLFAIIYRLGERSDQYLDVTVYDDYAKYNCAYKGKLVIGEQTPHAFKKVPVIEYRNNSEYQGDFEQVIPLIDAYNILQSDRINDKEQLVDAILVLYGFTMTEEIADGLRANRILADVPIDGKAEYLIKSLNEADTDTLRRVIENDIHKISMTPNMSDENFASNSSGVAIRYKLLAFEQAILNKERYFEKGLLERFEIYNNYLVSLNVMPKVAVYDVDCIFKRNLPQNDLETSQMINNLERFVDTETLLGQLSFIKNARETAEAKEAEEDALDQKEAGDYSPEEALTNSVQGQAKELLASENDTFLSKISKLVRGEN